MSSQTCRIKKILSFVLFCLVLFSLPVSAQDAVVSPGPITSIDLGVSSLNLKVGESYTFNVRYIPEDTILETLDWYVTDERVISIDPSTNTVTALADGEARIFAESFDQFSYDVCTVYVGNTASKDISVMKSGSDFFLLSPKDMKKIDAETLTRYLDFIADSALDETSYEAVSSRVFDVLAAVKPGKEESQSLLAKNCGVDDSEALKELNTITLTGSLGSILKYVKDNPDLVAVYEFGPFAVEDPIYEEVSSESIEKAITPVTLGGNTQALTNINFARLTLGLTGKNRWIAVIDSGIRISNPQFSGNRQIIEKCFSKQKNYGSYIAYPVCSDNAEGRGSSEPQSASNKTEFNHGSHVTGIAAGRNGVAPLANIISIQSHTERVWNGTAKEKRTYPCGDKYPGKCCKSHISNSDLARAYDYLVTLSKQRKIKIDAVNMSYGDKTKYEKTCDGRFKWEKAAFDKMIAQGMLPIVASGNQSFIGGLHNAACISNAYVVGGLANKTNPFIRSTSSHSRKVDITAPGTDIYSAGYYPDSMMKMSGTSMATPMVSGAIALVKQMYPGMTSADAGQFLKTISTKTVNQRSDGIKFKYNKPVLNFSRLYQLTVPYYSWVTGGNRSVTIKVYRVARPERFVKFSAQIRTLSGAALETEQKVWTEGNYTYIMVSSKDTRFQNGGIYNIRLTRTITVNGKPYSSSTNEYGRPVNAKATTPKTSVGNGSVVLTSVEGTIRYKIYDQSGNLVKQAAAKNGLKPLKVSGLVNGKLYTVSASTYKNVVINRKGKKLNIPFYSGESVRASFVPMSVPFNAKLSYPAVETPTSVSFSCTADKGVTGIKIQYQKKGTSQWIDFKTQPGKFYYDIPGTGRDYNLRVWKYKIVNGRTYSGPAIVVNGR